jgi:hypothetical protein
VGGDPANAGRTEVPDEYVVPAFCLEARLPERTFAVSCGRCGTIGEARRDAVVAQRKMGQAQAARQARHWLVYYMRIYGSGASPFLRYPPAID